MDTLILYAAAAIGLIISLIKDRKKTFTALKKAWKALEGILPQFITVILVIAISLSILDKVFISKLLGTESGMLGIIGAALLGAITLIPGFVAFPLAAALLANGAGVVQVATFVSSLMMVGVVTLPIEIKYFGKRIAFTRNLLAFGFSFGAGLLFETKAMGRTFALSRLFIDIIGIIVLAYAIKALLPPKEVERLYADAAIRD